MRSSLSAREDHCPKDKYQGMTLAGRSNATARVAVPAKRGIEVLPCAAGRSAAPAERHERSDFSLIAFSLDCSKIRVFMLLTKGIV